MTDDKLMDAIHDPGFDDNHRDLIREEARRRSPFPPGVTRTDLMAIGMKLLGIYFLVMAGTELIYTLFEYAPSLNNKSIQGLGVSLPVYISRMMLRGLCMATAGVWLVVTGNKELERKGRDSSSDPENLE